MISISFSITYNELHISGKQEANTEPVTVAIAEESKVACASKIPVMTSSVLNSANSSISSTSTTTEICHQEDSSNKEALSTKSGTENELTEKNMDSQETSEASRKSNAASSSSSDDNNNKIKLQSSSLNELETSNRAASTIPASNSKTGNNSSMSGNKGGERRQGNNCDQVVLRQISRHAKNDRHHNRLSCIEPKNMGKWTPPNSASKAQLSSASFSGKGK